MLLAQQIEHGGVLGFVELIGIFNTQLRLLSLQVQRRVGDVDWAVIGLHATFVGFAVGQILRFKHHAPAGGCGWEGAGVVHQYVRAPLIRRAVGLLVNRVPRRILEARVEILPVGNQRGVNRLHASAAD